MNVVYLAAVASLFVSAVIATEAEKKELLEKSKTFMDNYYKDVIKELKKLKDSGKKYNATDAKTMAAMISVEQFTKRTAESTDLIKLKEKLEKSGEVKDFQIYEQGSPELKKELQQTVSNLVEGGGIAPRFFGSLAMGLTQLSSDVAKMGLTRY